MKNILIVLSLVAFFAATTVSVSAVNQNSDTKVVNIDKEKCKVCGKEGCTGKCDAKKVEGHKCSTQTQGHKCGGATSTGKPCCDKKAGAKCGSSATKTPCSQHKTEEKKTK